jgi:hypothetical protein
MGGAVKWFKHDVDGNRSEGLAKLRAAMGWPWLARWYVVLEMVAEKMDETNRCHLELPMSDWCSRLDCSQSDLWRFFDVCRNWLHCSVETVEGSAQPAANLRASSMTSPCILHDKSVTSPCIVRRNSPTSRSKVVRISIPNLLTKKDEYSRKVRRKSGQNPDMCPDKIRNRVKIQSKDDTPPPVESERRVYNLEGVRVDSR